MQKSRKRKGKGSVEYESMSMEERKGNPNREVGERGRSRGKTETWGVPLRLNERGPMGKSQSRVLPGEAVWWRTQSDSVRLKAEKRIRNSKGRERERERRREEVSESKDTREAREAMELFSRWSGLGSTHRSKYVTGQIEVKSTYKRKKVRRAQRQKRWGGKCGRREVRCEETLGERVYISGSIGVEESQVRLLTAKTTITTTPVVLEVLVSEGPEGIEKKKKRDGVKVSSSGS